MKKVELLAPVGKLENALAAIENGADAIFVGGKAFNARHYADNFGDEALEEIVKYCKLRGVKTHVTVNILIKEIEMPDLMAYLAYLESLEVDAVIVQDFGVAKLIKTHFPNLVLHASTQMTAHSLEDVRFLETCGFQRVVLARELQLEEIAAIKQHTPLEIETFVHGALCYAYSGQCLLSSMIGGRSGNRGRCAQPCRMTYNLYKEDVQLASDAYLLSPKDTCTLARLPELIASGIDSFKMEGRMKSPEYVASVTQIYRKYIDLAYTDPAHYAVDPEDLATLQSIFNRGGFSEGYYHTKSDKKMMTEKTPKNIGLHIGEVTRYQPKTKLATFYTNKTLNPGDGLEIWNQKKHTGTGISKVYEAGTHFTLPVEGWVDEGAPVYLSKNHELLKTMKKTYEKAQRKLPVQGKLYGALGEPVTLTMTYEDKQVTAVGPVLEQAANRPITEEDARKQFSKLGNTPFKFDTFESVWAEGAYMNVGEMNALRREAVAHLETALLERKPLKEHTYEAPMLPQKSVDKTWCVQVRTMAQLEEVCKMPHVQCVYWELQEEAEALAALAVAKEAGKKVYLALPAIIRDAAWATMQQCLARWEETCVDGYLIRNYGTFQVLRNSPKEKVIDYTLNLMNNEAIAHWFLKGATCVTPSVELSAKELSMLSGHLEKIVYGHLPVMTTEQCLVGHYKACHKHTTKATYRLQDRKGVYWPLVTDCKQCKMQVLMDKPIDLTQENGLSALPFSRYRIVLTHETAEATQAILQHAFLHEALTTETQLGIYLKPIE